MHNNISISSLLYNILHYEKQFVFVSSEKHCMTLLIYWEGQTWIPKSAEKEKLSMVKLLLKKGILEFNLHMSQ